MPISRLGKRRQVVIPKGVCQTVGLREGDFVAVEIRRGVVVIKPKMLVDAEDTLTPEEEEIVLKGERQLRSGEHVTLEKLEHDLDRQARKGRRRTA